MSHYTVSASAYIPAAAARVYNILADYRHGHPNILPPKHFQNLEIEQGGFGAGTKIRFQMKLMGATHSFRAQVSEPHPGRLLVESDLDSGTFTTFTITPTDQPDYCLVKIATRLPAPAGALAFIERFLVSRVLKSIYTDELGRLAACATGRLGTRTAVVTASRAA